MGYDVEQLPADFSVKTWLGDDYPFDVLVTELESGNAIDFTNWSGLVLTIYDSKHTKNVQEQFKVSDSNLTVTSSGRMQADFSSSDTENWPEKVYFEAEGDNPDADTRTIIKGIISIER